MQKLSLHLRLVYAIILIALLNQSFSLQVAAAPSPDFDGSGIVDFPDFLLFVSAFGAQEGQEKYEAKYDLNSDGKIGFEDFLIFASSFGKMVQAGISDTYQQFLEARENGTEPILPDFSYAGYHYFNKPVPDVAHPIFDVTTYGAIPNDNISDQLAIQAAIDAAEANGRGIVFFSPGEFLVNTNADNNEPIYIHSSNIVLRGSGSRAGGTVIRQANHLPADNPDQLWSTPYMLIFKPIDTSYQNITRITESAERETFWITVEDASQLAVGQRIKVYMQSTEAINEFLAPRSPNLTGVFWEKLVGEGITIDEEHSIAEIQGNRIRLNEPLHAHVNPAHKWRVRVYPHLEEVGVEDISFHGSFLEEFVHHKNTIHDGGYSLVEFDRCVNSWVRRTSFINVSRGFKMLSSAAVSVYQITVGGNKGHYAIKSQGSYGIWVGLSEDLANQFHGVGMSHSTTGNVVYRFDMGSNQPIDIHMTRPSYANLYDRVNNGRLYGSSGSGVPPHHLRRLVLWNFNHGGNDTHYGFWGADYTRFLHPIVVGFHGNPATFNEKTLEVLESNGSPVEPESLFEAQLELRLETLPIWLNDLRTQWDMLRNTLLPNGSPVATGAIPAQALAVGTDGTLDVADYFIDPDDDVLTYGASSSDESIATVDVMGSVVTITPVASGRATITVTASDGRLSAEQTIDVIERGLPVATGTIPAQALTVGTDGTLDVASYFADPNNAPLTYKASSSDESIAMVDVMGSVVTITPVASGRATITVTVSNSSASAEQTIDVKVTRPGSMYWLDSGTDKIQRADLDGDNIEDLVTGLRTPLGIAIAGDKMYWTDGGTNKIQRADLNGGNVEDLVTGLNKPVGIAIAGDKVYWVDSDTDKIQRADLDGSNIEDLITTGLDIPVGIAIAGDKIYWTDNGTNKIQRADLNGGNVEDLVTGLAFPAGIALDIVGGKMYWTDRQARKIQRADLGGSNVEDLITTGLTSPADIALDIAGGKMYWVDRGTGKIQCANLALREGENTRTVEDLVTELGVPSGIALKFREGD